MTTPKLDQAREWAESVGKIEGLIGTRAAAEVIQSLPDQWIDAEKVRELITPHLESENSTPALWELVKNLRDLLPTPSLPTLADMTPEERESCRWMQAQTWHEVGIIVWVDEMTEIAQLITRENGVLERKFKDVTPLPDLPKLEWPSLSVSGESEAVSVETEESEGLPRPEDVPAGEPWIVLCGGKRWVGVRADTPTRPWSIVRMDGRDIHYVSDSKIALISLLVPETL